MRAQWNKSELRSFLYWHPPAENSERDQTCVPEGLSEHICLSKRPSKCHQVRVLKIILWSLQMLEEETTTLICGTMKLNILLAKMKESDTYKIQSLWTKHNWYIVFWEVWISGTGIFSKLEMFCRLAHF